MRMKKSTLDYLAEFSPGERARILQESKKIVANIRLEQIRKSRNITQKIMAKRLAVSQPRVSKAENSADIRLSTMNQYAAALGGKLRIEIEFPDGVVEPVLSE